MGRHEIEQVVSLATCVCLKCEKSLIGFCVWYLSLSWWHSLYWKVVEYLGSGHLVKVVGPLVWVS